MVVIGARMKKHCTKASLKPSRGNPKSCSSTSSLYSFSFKGLKMALPFQLFHLQCTSLFWAGFHSWMQISLAVIS